MVAWMVFCKSVYVEGFGGSLWPTSLYFIGLKGFENAFDDICVPLTGYVADRSTTMRICSSPPADKPRCWWQCIHFKYISNQSANALVSSAKQPSQTCPAPFLIKSLEGTFNDSNFFMYIIDCVMGQTVSLSP
jgi:hypothetical protein